MALGTFEAFVPTLQLIASVFIFIVAERRWQPARLKAVAVFTVFAHKLSCVNVAMFLVVMASCRAAFAWLLFRFISDYVGNAIGLVALVAGEAYMFAGKLEICLIVVKCERIPFPHAKSAAFVV